MTQQVENLKRVHAKKHTELEEPKQVLLQNEVINFLINKMTAKFLKNFLNTMHFLFKE